MFRAVKKEPCEKRRLIFEDLFLGFVLGVYAARALDPYSRKTNPTYVLGTMLVTISPSFLIYKFTFTYLALPTIQRFTA